MAGTSGFLVERPADPDAAAAAMADGFLALWSDIRAGRLDPDAIRALVRPYSVAVQMPKLFDRHRALARGRTAGGSTRPVSA